MPHARDRFAKCTCCQWYTIRVIPTLRLCICSHQAPIDKVEALRRLALAGGGERRVAAQHAKGKLTAR